jgi:hypothetical protein
MGALSQDKLADWLSVVIWDSDSDSEIQFGMSQREDKL